MAILPPVSMLPKPAKTPHLFCAVHSMPKLFPDVTTGNEPQRGITHTKALVYFTLEGTHVEDAPKPPTHAPLALRRSGPVVWTPSHP